TATLLFGHTAGFTTLAWASLYPELWIHVTRFWSEGLFIALTAGLFYALARGERATNPIVPWVAGALLGLLVLTRPNGVFFAPVIACCVGRSLTLPRRLGQAFFALAAFVIVITPW